MGNFRSFLFADVLVRYLRWRGLRVTWVMNLTDVDDKIIRGAAAESIGIDVLAARHIEGFLADAATLRMTMPDVLPRATAHIPQMVALVEALLERGPRLPDGRRLHLLPDRVLARLRAPGPPGSRRDAGGGAGRGRRVLEGRRP